MAKPIIISKAEYRDKVYACWLGKNIGGTLGAPYEGRKEPQNLTYYDPLPSESAANDDLDLQLVWLKMLQERGINPRLQDFADYWMKHLYPYPWDEYGFCQRNLQRGLRPPISGCFENDFIDQMGSPIRSEIWACIAPGDPQLAAVMAWKDAVLDHAGGEGIWGEMFWAAVESAAFVINDPLALIRIGLSMIPIWSHISRSITAAVWCYQHNIPWQQAREKILARFGHNHPCHAPQNHGFTIIGWLYGKDYGDKLCKAVNCGYDTDCTGATLGSVLGILGGTKGIPEEWSSPVGDGIVLHKFTQKLDAPKTIGELTDQTVEIGKKVLSQRSKIAMLGEETKFPSNILHIYSLNEKARSLWQKDMEAATIPISKDMEVTLHYHGEPVIRPGIPKILSITIERNEEPIPANAKLEFPPEWHVKTIESSELEMAYEVLADKPQNSNIVKANVEVGGNKFGADFIILGPNASEDWQPAAGVPHCSKCGARIEACLCHK
ncbi:MAG: ADP-ribosylglycohydrolase family protein [Armatimonadota bacterium]|nr:ADP-ribosylglycohydrolase family protein [Armatimonadota bacterium]